VNKLRQYAMTCAWRDVERLLYRTIHRFRKKHGGDFDDYLGLAHLAFMKAFAKHQNSIAQFNTYVTYLLWRECQTLLRRTIKSQQQLPMVFNGQTGLELNPLASVPNPAAPEFRLFHFVRQLSSDAQEVTLITVAQPDQHHRPEFVRRRVKRVLHTLGWKLPRIHAAFAEISNALRDHQYAGVEA